MDKCPLCRKKREPKKEGLTCNECGLSSKRIQKGNRTILMDVHFK